MKFSIFTDEKNLCIISQEWVKLQCPKSPGGPINFVICFNLKLIEKVSNYPLLGKYSVSNYHWCRNFSFIPATLPLGENIDSSITIYAGSVMHNGNHIVICLVLCVCVCVCVFCIKICEIRCCVSSSRKHVRAMNTPLNPTFI